MNVTVVVDNLEMGGGHHYAVQLVNSLANRGLDVALAYGDRHANPLSAIVGERVRRLPLPLAPTVTAKYRHLSNTASAVRVLAADLRGRRAVVHTLFAASGLPAWIAAAFTRTPVVTTPLATSVATNPLTARLYRTRVLERLVTRHVALSGYLGGDIVRAFGVSPAKVDVCRLGVDTGRFRPGDDDLGERTGRLLNDVPADAPRYWVGLAARLDPAKHVDLAVRAVAEVDRSLGVHLAVVGDGPLRQELERLAGRLGARDRVHFLGQFLDVSGIVPCFDTYIQTTEGPNLGLSALEALASGVPLLIAVRDADERLMAEDTLLGRGGGMADASPPALARAIEAAVRQSPEGRARARSEARALAEEVYDWEAHVDCVIGVYERMLAGGDA